MRVIIILLGCACLLAGSAQPNPDAPQPDDPRQGVKLQEILKLAGPQMIIQPPLMVTTPAAVFVVRQGVLAKYDARTLETQGMVELFGPPPAEENAENPLAKLDWIRRLAPGAMLAEEQELLIVIGEQYFRVNRATLEVQVSASLFKAQALAPVERLMAVLSPPVLAMQGETLYVTRGNQLLAVNRKDGVVRGVGALPNLQPVKAPAARAARGKAKPRGKNAGAPAREVVVIGTLLRHADKDGDFWALKADEGGEYLLSGDPLDRLLDDPKAAGARLRVTGLLTPPAPDDFGKGELEIVKYEILR